MRDTYSLYEAKIEAITAKRDELAGHMIKMLEDAAFNNLPIDEARAATLIKEAYELIDSVQRHFGAALVLWVG